MAANTLRLMRKINKIIIHCSATPAGRHVTVEELDLWHRQQGFNCIGYHYVIYLDGTVEQGRHPSIVGAHCHGHNTNSIGICYIGGIGPDGRSADTRTPQQKAALVALVAEHRAQFPEASVHGHNEFAAKDCPCFNVQAEVCLCGL